MTLNSRIQDNESSFDQLGSELDHSKTTSVEKNKKMSSILKENQVQNAKDQEIVFLCEKILKIEAESETYRKKTESEMDDMAT